LCTLSFSCSVWIVYNTVEVESKRLGNLEDKAYLKVRICAAVKSVSKILFEAAVFIQF